MSTFLKTVLGMVIAGIAGGGIGAVTGGDKLETAIAMIIVAVIYHYLPPPHQKKNGG